MTTLGDRLYALRRRKGLSQEALGGLAKVRKQTIYNIERGATLNPNSHTLGKLATALEVRVEDLLKGENKVFAPPPSSLVGIHRPYQSWNEAQLRSRILAQISPDLARDPLEMTRFIDHLDILSDYRWLNDPEHYQTSTMEFSDIWSDPEFFINYEATLLHFDKAGRRVDRIFQVDFTKVTHAPYLAMVKQVFLRHRALGLAPRVVRLDQAGMMHKDIGAICDIMLILDAKWTLMGRYLPNSEPAFVRSENRAFAIHASNVFEEYWKACPSAEAFLRRFPPSQRELNLAEQQAEQVHLASEFSRGL
jgi:transcriptional regulator with XRE-family HTH domain